MSDDMLMFAAGLSIGIAIGVVVAWEFLVGSRQPQIVITPEVLRQIDAATVDAWLNARGLTCMPAGRDFRWPHQVGGRTKS